MRRTRKVIHDSYFLFRPQAEDSSFTSHPQPYAGICLGMAELKEAPMSHFFFFSFFRFRCSLQRLGSPFHLSVERCVESVWMHCQLIDCGSDRGRVQSVWMHCPLLVAAIVDARFSTVLASRNRDSILHVNQSGVRCVRVEDRIERAYKSSAVGDV